MVFLMKRWKGGAACEWGPKWTVFTVWSFVYGELSDAAEKESKKLNRNGCIF